MIKFLIEKEFKQLLRNSFLPRLILIFPCMIMLLMPWAVNLEIKNIYLRRAVPLPFVSIRRDYLTRI